MLMFSVLLAAVGAKSAIVVLALPTLMTAVKTAFPTLMTAVDVKTVIDVAVPCTLDSCRSKASKLW